MLFLVFYFILCAVLVFQGLHLQLAEAEGQLARGVVETGHTALDGHGRLLSGTRPLGLGH